MYHVGAFDLRTLSFGEFLRISDFEFRGVGMSDCDSNYGQRCYFQVKESNPAILSLSLQSVP